MPYPSTASSLIFRLGIGTAEEEIASRPSEIARLEPVLKSAGRTGWSISRAPWPSSAHCRLPTRRCSPRAIICFRQPLMLIRARSSRRRRRRPVPSFVNRPADSRVCRGDARAPGRRRGDLLIAYPIQRDREWSKFQLGDLSRLRLKVDLSCPSNAICSASAFFKCCPCCVVQFPCKLKTFPCSFAHARASS